MRRVALALGLIAASTAGAQGFEGVVTYSMGMNGANGANGSTWEYMAKGNKVRFQSDDPRAAGMGMIMDMSARTITMIMPLQKMYMTQAIPQYNNTAADTMHGKITKVGSETVAGVPCDDYQGTDAQGQKKTLVCIAHGMGSFVMGNANNGMFKSMASHVQGFSEAFGGGGFPLKVVNENGQVMMLATKIDKRSLDDAMFTPPADFKQMQLPAGMAMPGGPPPQH
jgi:Domain of unknown function (DUF4412)